jgi:hypothetical protein
MVWLAATMATVLDTSLPQLFKVACGTLCAMQDLGRARKEHPSALSPLIKWSVLPPNLETSSAYTIGLQCIRQNMLCHGTQHGIETTRQGLEYIPRVLSWTLADWRRS